MDYFKSRPIRCYLPLSAEAVEAVYPRGFEPESDVHPRVVFYSEPTAGAVADLRRMGPPPGDSAIGDADHAMAFVLRRLATQAWRIEGDWRIYRRAWGPRDPEFPSLEDEDGLEDRLEFFARLTESDLLAMNAALSGTEAIDEDAKKK